MDQLFTAFADKANLIGAAVVAVLSWTFGAHWQVFVLFLALNVVDFSYGMLKAKRTDTLSSAKGANGICKKVSYWVVIALAFAVSEVLVDFGETIGAPLSFLRLLGWFTLGVYILNELTSIVENLVVLGYDVPEIVVRGLNAAHSVVDAAGDKVLPEKTEEDKGE
ncbi:phage holin family protein [Agathobaculum sp. Marseille-P7918]|uniref:phage holin family protein n=1 Tax=Agathobaculum sp. Marseille-P7918 TaxID=2479843 RepID=UPI000F642E32|nr:phage holin family protein [Agathobaculum sp. Marseille-P7918]